MIRYNFLNSIRDKSTIFWVAFYPLIILTIFTLAFSQIQSQNEIRIPVGVDPNNPFASIYPTIDLLEVSEISPDRATELLESEAISSYIDAEGNLILKEAGFKATIVKSILDQIRQMIALEIPREAYDFERNYTVNTNHASGIQSFLIYYYALFGMIALQSSQGALSDICSIQANLSFLGQRIEIAPTRKWVLILKSSLVTLSTNFTISLATFLVAVYVFRHPLLQRPMESFLMLLLINLFGIALGLVVGLSSRLSLNVKSGILIAVVITLSAMGGMMGVGLRTAISRFAPWLLKINPVSLFTDTMFRINVTGDASTVVSTLVILGIEITVMMLIATQFLRRRQYGSI
ncbi:MAG: ABC transporter permease [Bacillota bacterium]|nr:ABC transporter permease [Bacillota bacterium]